MQNPKAQHPTASNSISDLKMFRASLEFIHEAEVDFIVQPL
jgi:hypothetical protein